MRGSQVTREIKSAVPTAGELRALSISLLAFAALLVLCAGPAFAAKTHALKTTFGSFSNPSGIAIDEANGNVFVADAGTETVEIFGPEGGAPSGVAVTKIKVPANSGRQGVAIDNAATSPSKGALYVDDGQNQQVKKFTLNPISEEYEPAGELISPPDLGGSLGIAVDAKGNVFVGYTRNTVDSADAIIEFSPSGVEIARIEISSTTSMGAPDALSFDSAGNLYALSHWGAGVWKFAANGAGEIEPATQPIRLVKKESPTGIAVDQDSGALYVAEKTHIDQYSTSCTPVKDQCPDELSFGFGTLRQTSRIAVNQVSGAIYVSDHGIENKHDGDVAVFDGATAIAPDAVTGVSSAVKPTEATLNGTISAAGGPQASCEFQYVTKAAFGAKGFEGASAAPCSPAGPFTGSSIEAVKADLSALAAETTYAYRLVGSNENGLGFGEVLFFGTIGKPKITASFASDVSLTSATLSGRINPNGGPGALAPTAYAIEYVSEADFKANGYANATSLPTPLSAGGESIGSGIEDVEVSQRLTNLSASTTYHFRLVAENEAGTETGPDKIFATYLPAPAGLPDGRAYEQATPVDKAGASPSGDAGAVMAADSGGGIAYFSAGSIPGGEGAQELPTYLSSRSPDGSGWSTQGILPSAINGSYVLSREPNEDLSQTYATQAVTPDDPLTLYQRDSGTHALRPIAVGVGPGGTPFAGESTDGSKVLLELDDNQQLAGAAPGARNTYVWDNDTSKLSLVGILNDEQAPAGGTAAGASFYTTPTYTRYQRPISADGSRVFFTSITTRQLYVRLNPTQPQSAMEGEKCSEPEMACTIQVSASKRTTAPLKDEKESTLWVASTDGSQAFFTSSGKLTNNATTGPKNEGNDLYRFDTTSGQLSDLTHDAADPNGAEVQGVIGASEDGSYVYFVANGVLASNPGADGSLATLGDCANHSDTPVFDQSTFGDCNLYLWHDGVTTYVAPQRPAAGGSEVKENSNWLRAPYLASTPKTARISADGRTLLFYSTQQLTSYENQGVGQLYRYGADDGKLNCISCNPTGAAPVGPVTERSIKPFYLSSNLGHPLLRNLSADGMRVFFETPDKLVASDVNGDNGCPVAVGAQGGRACQDVYEWEAKGAGSCDSEAQNGGCLYLISTGTSSEPAFFADASASGDDVFFYTTQQLVRQDQDQITDIYDARVGGGIAAQNELPPPVCEGEACKGSVPAVPPSESAGSASFSGPADPKPSRHKKKQHKHKKQKHKQKKSNAARKHG